MFLSLWLLHVNFRWTRQCFTCVTIVSDISPRVDKWCKQRQWDSEGSLHGYVPYFCLLVSVSFYALVFTQNPLLSVGLFLTNTSQKICLFKKKVNVVFIQRSIQSIGPIRVCTGPWKLGISSTPIRGLEILECFHGALKSLELWRGQNNSCSDCWSLFPLDLCSLP